MPIFECARCNALTYSASRAVAFACEKCRATTARVLEDQSFSTVKRSTRRPERGDHCVAVYHGCEEGAAIAAPFIEEGMHREELTVVEVEGALRGATERLLAPGMAEAVEWVDPQEVVGDAFDADRMEERLRELAASTHSLRIVGAFDLACAERTDPLELRRYERLAHDAILELGVTALCLYDAELCQQELLATARVTHPLAQLEGTLRCNPEFAWPPTA